MFTTHQPYSPSPSPPSSPSLACTDSSPTSSPALDPTSRHGTPEPLSLPHPLAACVKATRSPKLHEKKTSTPVLTPLNSASAKKSRYRESREDDVYLHDWSQPPDHEREIWSETIARVIDSNNGTIELKYVQSFVRVLSHTNPPFPAIKGLSISPVKSLN